MKKRILIPFLIIALAAIFIIFSETATESALEAMRNAVSNIIPALFPYMVISTLIIESGAADILGRILPISQLLKLPKCASAPMIIGAICGFPLGARAAAELYEKGYLSKTQAEVLISAANNTGPTFIIFVIGSIYWQSASFGIYLYFAQLVCVLLASLTVNRVIFPIKEFETELKPVITIKPFLTAFSDAIKNAAVSSLNICGFITFFAVLLTVEKEIFFFLPDRFHLFLSAVSEFSEAAKDSANIGGVFGAFFCGAAIGWSGLSVLCQTAACISNSHLSLKRYVAVKTTEGLLLGGSSALYAHITNLRQIQSCMSEQESVEILPTVIILSVLVLIYFICKIKKRKYA